MKISFYKKVVLLILSSCTLSSCTLSSGIKDSNNLISDDITNTDLIIDVRTEKEFSAGHIPEAINIPHDRIEERISEIEDFKTKKVILYCRGGRRSEATKKILEQRGYVNVINVGGYEDIR